MVISYLIWIAVGLSNIELYNKNISFCLSHTAMQNSRPCIKQSYFFLYSLIFKRFLFYTELFVFLFVLKVIYL